MKMFFLSLSLVFSSVAFSAQNNVGLPAVNGTIAGLADLTQNPLTLRISANYDNRHLDNRDFEIESKLGRDGSFSLPETSVEISPDSSLPVRLTIEVIDQGGKTWFLHKTTVYPGREDAAAVYTRMMQNWRIYQSVPDFGLNLTIPQGDSLNAYMEKILKRFRMNPAAVDWQVAVNSYLLIRPESDNTFESGIPYNWDSSEPEICYGRTDVGCTAGDTKYFTKANSANIRGAISLRLSRSANWSPKLYMHPSILKQRHQFHLDNLTVKLKDRRNRDLGTIYIDFGGPGAVDIYDFKLVTAGQRPITYGASLPSVNSSRVRYFKK